MKRASARLWAGIALLAGVWLWPLPWLDLPPFTHHMVAHMTVVALASPLIALALADRPVGMRLPEVVPPLPASVIDLVAVWGWHTPALHHLARQSPVGFALEQTTFLVAGVALWLSALGGDLLARRRRAAHGITALLLTSMHMTLLGALLTLPLRPLFHHGEAHAWLSPTHDQQLGGAVMLLVGGVAYLLGALRLTAEVLAPEGA